MLQAEQLRRQAVVIWKRTDASRGGSTGLRGESGSRMEERRGRDGMKTFVTAHDRAIARTAACIQAGDDFAVMGVGTKVLPSREW